MYKNVLKFFVLFFAIMLVGSNLIAQITVKGSVTSDAAKPLKDVQIRLKGGLEVISTTDANGKFEIVVPDNSTKVLIFSSENFDTQEVPIKSSGEINVVMVASVRYNQYGKVVKRIPLMTESRNGILVFESESGDCRYWLDSRVYFDGLVAFGEPLNPIGNGVTIRRARFALKAYITKNWYGEIDLDFANSQMELKDAYLKYERDMWAVKAGNFKEGFSMETTTTSRYLTFVERSLVSEFGPSRHLGIQGSAWGKHWLVIGGVHFQDIGDSEVTTFSQNANKDFGTDEGMSYTGRLVITPFVEQNKLLHIGAAATYRTPMTSDEIPNSYRVSTRSLTSINRKKYLDTDDILNVESRTMFDFELAASWKQFMFQGEYMISNVNRSGEQKDASFDGMYLQAGYLLFGGSYVYNAVDGEFTQVNRGKSWGDIEVAVRYDYLNLNDFDAKIYGGAANAYTFGINYHVNDNVKIMINYSYIDHDRFADGKGKLFIYKADDGTMYKDAFDVEIPTGEGGDDYGFITGRIEIDF